MRGLVFASLLSLLSLPALAQEEPIRNTILNQIEAFKADDFARAFAFASPTIKGIFMTPENFGTMVRNGYPMVHRPADVKMLELREVAGALWQKVMVTDQQGKTHVLDYQMVETPDGWQINAVQLLPSGGVGV